MPTVSVIVPVYNSGKYLKRCADSLLGQVFQDFEVIFVDDGSTDDSGTICDSYAKLDNRFLVLHKRNAGVSCARTDGLKTAKGKYICFVDSDDYVKPDYISCMLDAIVLNSADLVISGVGYVTQDGSLISVQGGDNENEMIERETLSSGFSEKKLAELLRENRFNYVYGKLYRRDIIEDNHLTFNTDISLGEDTLFVLDYLKHVSSIYIVGDWHYYYVKYGTGTLSSSLRDNTYQMYVYVNSNVEKVLLDIADNPGAELKDAINDRRIDSIKWSIRGYALSSKYSLRKKLNLLCGILNSNYAIEALCYCNKIDGNEIRLLKRRCAILLFLYYNIKENNILLSCYLKCKNIFQSNK